MDTIIVVEGKSDTNKLKSIYKNIQTFETSGLGLTRDMISELKKLNKKIIVFTDPDGPGEIIRNRIASNIDDVYHAYLPNDKALSKDKLSIGVEHATEEDIKNALECLYQKTENKFNYELEDLIEIGIYNDKPKRKEFCDAMQIAYGNNKKVLNQLNNFNIEPKKIKGFCENYEHSK